MKTIFTKTENIKANEPDKFDNIYIDGLNNRLA